MATTLKEQSPKRTPEILQLEVALPPGITVEVTKNLVTVRKGGKAISKKFVFGDLKLTVRETSAQIIAPRKTRAAVRLARTLEAHLNNLCRGVQEGFTYTLKICAGHFPMNVSVAGQDFIIKNFLGESVPRKLRLPPDVVVKVAGDQVTVHADSKESAGQIAARIEKLTVVKGRDLRVFQDGIYITHKGNKGIL